ncbi:MAG: aminotransferase class III-fold pyridoxal phosphate-dependent enzyme [Geminicoccaceae bacterium]|nr:aminotransferase class III-fold pyridoxal phosphate-dependent enzyme [Geminicoccaceae bacterium]
MATARTARRGAKFDLEEAVAQAEARYVAAHPKSREIFERNLEVMPGGNTRTVLFFHPFPVVIARGAGARLFDVDGHEYVDWLGEYSAGLYGHSHPVITAAIREALEEGIALGGPNRFEGALAAELCRRFPSLQLVRFCNSGTEANLFAISAARAYTGRPAVMVFEGGYHGGVFHFRAGEGAINAPFPWVVAPFNDLDGTLALLEERAKELAAVLVEPVQGSAGAIPAEPAFLRTLREACTRHGICLIFDEVMTSRSSAGGMQARLGVTPDLTTLGKYLGGGLGLAAFGGKAAIMAQFDPRRPRAIPHAGTFNNAVLAMAAGLAGLARVATPEVLDAHFARGERLKARINALAAERRVPFCCTGAGSILALHCRSGPIRSERDLGPSERREKLQRLLHFELLERGHYLARRGYFTLSLPHTSEDEESLLKALGEFFAARRHLLAG